MDSRQTGSSCAVVCYADSPFQWSFSARFSIEQAPLHSFFSSSHISFLRTVCENISAVQTMPPFSGSIRLDRGGRNDVRFHTFSKHKKRVALWSSLTQHADFKPNKNSLLCSALSWIMITIRAYCLHDRRGFVLSLQD